MKTKFPLVAVLYPLLFAFTAYAQQLEPSTEQLQPQMAAKEVGIFMNGKQNW